MSCRITDILLTCEEFRLLRSESLESSLNIVLQPTSSPSPLFLNHLFCTPHSAHLFNSALKLYPQSVYFLPPLQAVLKLLFYPIRHLVPYFHFHSSTVCSSQRRQNYSFKIKIRTSDSFAQNLLVILVCPIRPCIFYSLAHSLVAF